MLVRHYIPRSRDLEQCDRHSSSPQRTAHQITVLSSSNPFFKLQAEQFSLKVKSDYVSLLIKMLHLLKGPFSMASLPVSLRALFLSAFLSHFQLLNLRCSFLHQGCWTYCSLYLQSSPPFWPRLFLPKTTISETASLACKTSWVLIYLCKIL